jgi:hypothetical protein
LSALISLFLTSSNSSSPILKPHLLDSTL